MKNLKTLTAAALAVSLSAAASAEAVFQYAVGAGDARSDLVIDFAGSGSAPGAAYAFSYFYDPAEELNSLDLLRAIDAGGDLDVAATTFSFGTAIDGFSYRNDSRVFESFNEGSFTYWVQGGAGLEFTGPEPTLRDYADDGYAVAASGVEGRFLSDGTVDAFRVADGTGAPPAAFPEVVPEPASAALLAGVGALLLRRRRA